MAAHSSSYGDRSLNLIPIHILRTSMCQLLELEIKRWKDDFALKKLADEYGKEI